MSFGARERSFDVPSAEIKVPQSYLSLTISNIIFAFVKKMLSSFLNFIFKLVLIAGTYTKKY